MEPQKGNPQCVNGTVTCLISSWSCNYTCECNVSEHLPLGRPLSGSKTSKEIQSPDEDNEVLPGGCWVTPKLLLLPTFGIPQLFRVFRVNSAPSSSKDPSIWMMATNEMDVACTTIGYRHLCIPTWALGLYVNPACVDHKRGNPLKAQTRKGRIYIILYIQ